MNMYIYVYHLVPWFQAVIFLSRHQTRGLVLPLPLPVPRPVPCALESSRVLHSIWVHSTNLESSSGPSSPVPTWRTWTVPHSTTRAKRSVLQSVRHLPAFYTVPSSNQWDRASIWRAWTGWRCSSRNLLSSRPMESIRHLVYYSALWRDSRSTRTWCQNGTSTWLHHCHHDGAVVLFSKPGAESLLVVMTAWNICQISITAKNGYAFQYLVDIFCPFFV